jgi:hypothetical protein
MNIRLDEEDFKCLVRGGVLKIGDIHIILSDIGFDCMDYAISMAHDGIDTYKDHIKTEGFK